MTPLDWLEKPTDASGTGLNLLYESEVRTSVKSLLNPRRGQTTHAR